MRPVVEALAEHVGVTVACDALGVPRSSLYAARKLRPAKFRQSVAPPRALTADEKTVVRQTLDSQRFADQAPREVFATLLDEGQYLCSVPTAPWSATASSGTTPLVKNA